METRIFDWLGELANVTLPDNAGSTRPNLHIDYDFLSDNDVFQDEMAKLIEPLVPIRSTDRKIIASNENGVQNISTSVISDLSAKFADNMQISDVVQTNGTVNEDAQLSSGAIPKCSGQIGKNVWSNFNGNYSTSNLALPTAAQSTSGMPVQRNRKFRLKDIFIATNVIVEESAENCSEKNDAESKAFNAKLPLGPITVTNDYLVAISSAVVISADNILSSDDENSVDNLPSAAIVFAHDFAAQSSVPKNTISKSCTIYCKYCKIALLEDSVELHEQLCFYNPRVKERNREAEMVKMEKYAQFQNRQSEGWAERQRDIVKRANDSKCFSILADEATNVVMSEMLSVSVRFVENASAFEYFLGFITLKSLTAESISNEIITFLNDVGLNLQYLRGQGYDGAAAMAGRISGVQARIKQLYPLATYVHCCAHTLNLALCAASSIRDISFAFAQIKEITFFVTKSAKRIEILKSVIRDNPKYDYLGRDRLLRLCETRWVEKHRSIQRFVELILPLYETLQKIVENGGDDVIKARSFAITLLRFDFLFCVHLMNQTATELANVSRNLQQVNSDLVECLKRIEKLKKYFSKMEANLLIFDRIYTDSQLRLSDMTGSMAAATAVPFNSEQYTTARQYYTQTIFLPYLKELQIQLQNRFNPQSATVFQLQKFVPVFIDDNLQPIKQSFETYIQPDNECSEAQFLAEYRSWKEQCISSFPAVDNVLDSLSKCSFNFEPNIYKLLQLLATIPVTTATAERSFSTMRRLNTYLRSTMSSERATGLALMNIHHNSEIDIDKVLHDFKIKNRKLDF